MVKKTISEQFDVLVIGGGPAGLMAAGRAAKCGARTALIEKNDRYGIKLLMTGNGRCNLTQEESDLLELSKSYHNGRFLLSSLNAFSPSEVRNFFAEKGVLTKVEKGGKIFPVSDQSRDVLDALYQYCRENSVTFFHPEEVVSIVKEGNKISYVETKKKNISAEKYILATGGKSYPHTGSSGQGLVWALEMGHSVIEPKPLLVPIKTMSEWREASQGISLRNVELNLFAENKIIAKEKGDVMLAHYGLSGPATLNISREVQKELGKKILEISIDLKPELSWEKVDEIVRKDFENNAGKKISNCLEGFLSPKLLELLLFISGLDLKKNVGNMSREERLIISKLIKDLRVKVEDLFGFEKAMVTGGGVATKEVDSKTMRSKLIDNLYFAGEILDVDGPTGGYNLQICWSTGFTAGENSAKEA